MQLSQQAIELLQKGEDHQARLEATHEILRVVNASSMGEIGYGTFIYNISDILEDLETDYGEEKARAKAYEIVADFIDKHAKI